MSSVDQPYLTLVCWPATLERRTVASFVAAACGLDAPAVNLRLGKPPPLIVGQVEGGRAKPMLAALRGRGFDAFLTTLADLEDLGPTLKIKDLRLVRGELEAELWRGPTLTFARAEIDLLVRGQLRRTITVPRPGPRPRPIRGVNPGVLPSIRLDPEPEETRRLETSDKLDVHLRDGRVLQIDGDKFGYRLLGELRGYSDKANMDSMCALLAHLAPNEIVDDFFTLWRPPAGYQRLRLPDMQYNRDDPAFAFYSRWAALLYRHISAG